MRAIRQVLSIAFVLFFFSFLLTMNDASSSVVSLPRLINQVLHDGNIVRSFSAPRFGQPVRVQNNKPPS